MANNILRGDALKVAGVLDFVFGGTWEADDEVNVLINNKTLNVVGGSTTISTVVDAVVTAFNALDEDLYPEFASITASRSSNTLRLTHDDEDVLFACTVSTTETGGGAADAQTIDGATSSSGNFTTTSKGPNHWSSVTNWSAGTIPANTEDVYLDGPTNLLYGLSQSGVTLTSLNVPQTYTGETGLPVMHGSGATAYYEYLTRDLTISATTVNFGYGDGTGTGRFILNLGTNASTINVYNTGSSKEDGVPALLIRGAHASNVLNVQRGNVGVAFFPGQTATIPVIRTGFIENALSDATLWCGAGVTLTTVNVGGGTVTLNSNVTTINLYDGEVIILAAATVGTLNAVSINKSKPVLRYLSSGTATQLNIGHDCTVDGSGDLRPLTITNCTMRKGASLILGSRAVTFSNAIVLSGCTDKDDVTIQTNSDYSIDFQ